MRITFVLPNDRSGGTQVLATYARSLTARGHRVVMISPPATSPRSRFGRMIARFGRAKPNSHLDEFGVEHRILKRWRPVRDSDVPEADIVIATWWETAVWAAKFRPNKGRKVHLVQGHENYPWLPRRSVAPYAFPMYKIVISKWLVDIMKEKYGASATLVLNGVDHGCFHAPERGKQARPTVGLLCGVGPLKGFEASISMLQDIAKHRPELRVLSFGFEAPPNEMPDFVEFSKDPPRDSLRSLYASCDVWLGPSLSEGFGLTAIEAMACRTPVVSFRTGWPAEALADGVNGACVDIGDFEALKRETDRILALSDDEWRRVSTAAWETTREMSWERSCGLLEAALTDALGRSSGQSAGPLAR